MCVCVPPVVAVSKSAAPCDAMPPRPCTEDRRRCLLLGNCLVLVCKRVGPDDVEPTTKETGPPGWSLFRGFVHENAQCFWNQCLVQSVACLEYRGYLIPSTIFVSGNDYTLEVVRSAWSRRVLRPPIGYEIQRLGESLQLSHSLSPFATFFFNNDDSRNTAALDHLTCCLLAGDNCANPELQKCCERVA